MLKNALLFLMSSATCFAGFGQGSGKLLLNKGDKYALENKFSLVSSSEMMGQAIESKSDFSTFNKIEVKDIKDNNYNLSNTITKVTATVSAMGQDMKFDSDKPEDMDGEMGKNMKGLINQPKDVMVDKQGKVIGNKNDTAKKAGGGEMMAMMMQQFLGNQEEGGYGVGEAFMVIPASAKTGFSWTDSSSGNGVKKSTVYTIKEIKGNESVVGISGVLDTDTKMEMQGMEITTKTKGKITGEQVVDSKTGVIKQRTTNVEASGNVQVMGQEMPITTKLNSVSTAKLM